MFDSAGKEVFFEQVQKDVSNSMMARVLSQSLKCTVRIPDYFINHDQVVSPLAIDIVLVVSVGSPWSNDGSI